MFESNFIVTRTAQDSQEACGQLSAQVESLKKESVPNLRRLSEMEADGQPMLTFTVIAVSTLHFGSFSDPGNV